MGAWGSGIYENDDAGDWAFELDDGGVAVVRSALEAVRSPGLVEARAGARALAAADVVARLAGAAPASSGDDDEIADWVAVNPTPPDDELVALARAAVVRVRGDGSELRELWRETSGGFDAWAATLDDLERRLPDTSAAPDAPGQAPPRRRSWWQRGPGR